MIRLRIEYIKPFGNLSYGTKSPDCSIFFLNLMSYKHLAFRLPPYLKHHFTLMGKVSIKQFRVSYHNEMQPSINGVTNVIYVL